MDRALFTRRHCRWRTRGIRKIAEVDNGNSAHANRTSVTICLARWGGGNPIIVLPKQSPQIQGHVAVKTSQEWERSGRKDCITDFNHEQAEGVGGAPRNTRAVSSEGESRARCGANQKPRLNPS
eukprot:scaffold510384_cov153-Attheya_sp.AAC.1